MKTNNGILKKNNSILKNKVARPKPGASRGRLGWLSPVVRVATGDFSGAAAEVAQGVARRAPIATLTGAAFALGVLPLSSWGNGAPEQAHFDTGMTPSQEHAFGYMSPAPPADPLEGGSAYACPNVCTPN